MSPPPAWQSNTRQSGKEDPATYRGQKLELQAGDHRTGAAIRIRQKIRYGSWESYKAIEMPWMYFPVSPHHRQPRERQTLSGCITRGPPEGICEKENRFPDNVANRFARNVSSWFAVYAGSLVVMFFFAIPGF